jgi:hypothetical protein
VGNGCLSHTPGDWKNRIILQFTAMDNQGESRSRLTSYGCINMIRAEVDCNAFINSLEPDTTTSALELILQDNHFSSFVWTLKRLVYSIGYHLFRPVLE